MEKKPRRVSTIEKAAEALRALSARQEAILAAVPDILMEVDKHKVYTWANPAGLAFFGEDVIGKEAAFYFEGEQDTYGQVKPLFNGSEDVIYVESWQRRKDGEKRLLAWWCRVLKDAAGNVAGALSSAHDTTERRQAEAALRESEDKYKYVFDYSPVGKSITFPTGEIHVNQAFCDMLGYSPEELQNHTWQAITLPDDIEATQRIITALLSGETSSARFNKRYIHKNGSTVWAEVSTSLRRDAAGKPLYFMTTLLDITERKRAEAALKTATVEWQTTFDAINDAVCLLDREGRILRCNQAMTEQLGKPAAAIIGRPCWEVVHCADGPIAGCPVARLKTSLCRETLELPIGDQWYAITAYPVLDEAGRLVGAVHIQADITARKQAEEALHESEDKFSKAFQTSPYAITITRPEDGTFIEVNDAFTSMAGVTREEALAGSSVGLELWVNEEDRQRVVAALRAGQAVVGKEYPFRTKSGKVITGLFSAQVIQLSQGLCILSSINDITERKRTEEALAESEKKLRTLFETMSEGIVYENHDGKIISANPAAERLLGLSFDQLQGRTSVDPRWKAIHADGSPFPGETHSLNVAAKTGKPATGEVMGIYNPKSGAYVWLSVNSTPEFLPGEKKPFRAYAVFRDITERKQAEDALQENDQRLASIYDTVGDIIFYLAVEPNEQYRFNSVNSAFGKVTGLPSEQVIGRKVNEIIPEPSLNMVLGKYRQAIEEKDVVRWEETSDYPNGRLTGEVSIAPVFDKAGNCTHLVGSVHDLTERKRAEQTLKEYSARLEAEVETRTRALRDAQEQLVRQEKLAVLGQLAGGVGHELRNPLAVINNAVYFLKLVQPEADEKVKEYLGMIEKETHTAEKIITDLLDFARIKAIDREPAAVSELVQNVLERYPAPVSVAVSLDFPASLPKVYVDPRQMEQVLGNLVVNACQAMATAGSAGTPEGGKLTIAAHRQAGMVTVSVKDTGMGIPPENIKKLFEPLFTTKLKGIGLGLVVSRKLAEANGGRIEVESEPGQGSIFTLYLPVYKE